MLHLGLQDGCFFFLFYILCHFFCFCFIIIFLFFLFLLFLIVFYFCFLNSLRSYTSFDYFLLGTTLATLDFEIGWVLIGGLLFNLFSVFFCLGTLLTFPLFLFFLGTASVTLNFNLDFEIGRWTFYLSCFQVFSFRSVTNVLSLSFF